MLLKWVARLHMSLTALFPYNWSVQYKSQYKRPHRKECAVTLPMQFPQKLPLKLLSTHARDFYIVNAKEFDCIAFKETIGSSVLYNDYVFACWYSSILERKWKQYEKTGATPNQQCFPFLMLVNADPNEKATMVRPFVSYFNFPFQFLNYNNIKQ